MTDIQKDLKALKENIETAKNSQATLQGRKMELLKQLKKDYGLNSVEDAQKEITRLEKESTKLETQIQKDYDKLKAEYDW